MKILVLTLYYEPDVAANAVIMTELVEELVTLGHEITVVTSMPHYAGNVMQEAFKGKLFHRENKGSIKIIRTYLYTSPNKKRFIVRFLNYVSFNLLSTLAGLFASKHDLILAPSPPLTVGLSAAIIGFLRRTPYVYNVQDIYPDVVVKLEILKNKLGITFSKCLERFVYRRAAHITVLSDGFRQNLLRKGVPEEKLNIIPNFVDTEFIQPMARENGFRKKLELDGKHVVLFAGNLGHSQDLYTVLEAAAELQEEKELLFLVVGEGSRKPAFKSKAMEFGLENVRFLPFQPRQDVPEIYASSDICLVPLKKDIARDSVPSKAYTIMAAGRPILASVDKNSDIWNLIQDVDCGICIPPEDAQSMVESILALHNDSNLRQRYGQNGREYVTQHFTRQMAGKKYHELFTSLICKSS